MVSPTAGDAARDWNRFNGLIASKLVGRQLNRLGFALETKTHSELAAADFAGRALVVVSVADGDGRLEASLERAGLPTAAVPVLCLEAVAFPALQMSGPVRGADFEWGVPPGPLDFAAHPMAAGLAGRRDFGGAVGGGWVRPGPGATAVATLAGRPDRAAAFALEAGARLADGRPAPARRAGLFLDPGKIAGPDSPAWALFEAAAQWCAAPAARTPETTR